MAFEIKAGMTVRYTGPVTGIVYPAYVLARVRRSSGVTWDIVYWGTMVRSFIRDPYAST